MEQLPIHQVLTQLQQTLQTERTAVLLAEPGAGKTTVVPLALLSAAWLTGRKILLLEPRRLAARLAARHMAKALGEEVGETVGYRVRGDSQVGIHTRLEVITEGILTRMLIEDPALEDVGLVIFDEFHERSIHADLGLALSMQTQSLLRDDLRLLVMSATLAAEPVAELLGSATIIRCLGRSYPVETHYEPPVQGESLAEGVMRSVSRAMLRWSEGDLLVFLPGEREIALSRTALTGQLPANVDVVPLYGRLPRDQQDHALRPSLPGRRRVVLATSIAESSLTVPGVRIVIDAGLSRSQRFSPRTGMSRLETHPVSMAAADQRRGRAGRTSPGWCIRLWSPEQERAMLTADDPEIAATDLAPLMLDLAAWGERDPAALSWLTPPPAAACRQASELLLSLGAIDESGALTPHGQQISRLGLHPRLGHMLLVGAALGWSRLACELAALLTVRENTDSTGGGTRVNRGAESQSLVDRWYRFRTAGRQSWPQTWAEAERWRSDLARIPQPERKVKEAVGQKRAVNGAGVVDLNKLDELDSTMLRPGTAAFRMWSYACGLLLAHAYPERIGRHRGSGRYLLSSGRGAYLGGERTALLNDEWIVAIEVEAGDTESRIWLAASVQWSDLAMAGLAEHTEGVRIQWNAQRQSLQSRGEERLGAIVVREWAADHWPLEEWEAAWRQTFQAEGLKLLPWTSSATLLWSRMRFAAAHMPDWPRLDESALLETMNHWLLPYLVGIRTLSELKRVSLPRILLLLLTNDQARQLDMLAPSHMRVPSGSELEIDYDDVQRPLVRARLQELFGMQELPRLASGRAALVLEILSPAHRPVQVTSDLQNFWNTTYEQVRKDLKGRYPKHYWPDDPWTAEAIRGVRPPKRN